VSERSATQLNVDVTAYLAGAPEAVVNRMNRELFGDEMPPMTRTALQAYAGAGTLDETRVRETLALALSAPAFQWY
jgi:hypothetical protein